jgi:predicted PhzF superfamily epimerase YddE/YHI9
MSHVPEIKLPLSVDLDGDDRTTHPYVVVDVFTQTPLEGNQLAVFTDGRGFDSAKMQSVARELNLAVTVFVLPAVGDGDLRVRIFTPGIELPFAGHPVLGTAFVAASALARDTVTLETDSGPAENVEHRRVKDRPDAEGIRGQDKRPRGKRLGAGATAELASAQRDEYDGGHPGHYPGQAQRDKRRSRQIDRQPTDQRGHHPT